MTTPLPHMNCSWCGVTMGITETATSECLVDQDGIRIVYTDGVIDNYHKEHPPEEEITVYLCYWCRKFESKEDRDKDTYEYFNQLIYKTLIGELDRSVWTGVG